MADTVPETIQTERLRLRRPVLEDAWEIYTRYAQDPEVTKYLTWRPHPDVATTQAFLARCNRCWQEAAAFPWVIVRELDGALLGMIEVRIDGSQANVGYGLAQAYWGQGYTTEALQTIIAWALCRGDIHRVWAVCDVANSASARVMAKAGMHCEGILPRYIVHPNIGAAPRDCYCYSVLRMPNQKSANVCAEGK
jgi:RimJ/RimL family protein N-acetyltransferase